MLGNIRTKYLVRNAPVYEGIETRMLRFTTYLDYVRNAPVYEGIETFTMANFHFLLRPECPGL